MCHCQSPRQWFWRQAVLWNNRVKGPVWCATVTSSPKHTQLVFSTMKPTPGGWNAEQCEIVIQIPSCAFSICSSNRKGFFYLWGRGGEHTITVLLLLCGKGVLATFTVFMSSAHAHFQKCTHPCLHQHTYTPLTHPSTRTKKTKEKDPNKHTQW